MRKSIIAAVSAVLSAVQVSALPQPRQPPTNTHENRASAPSPSVIISSGTIVGFTSNNVDSFSAIPFAEPPVGALRLRPPQKLNSSLGVFDASHPAGACPQMALSTSGNSLLTSVLGTLIDTPLFQTATGISEDCLTITVQRPTGTTADSGLPVLFYIFGGGFELGWSSMYDGSGLVQQGINLDEPFVYVAVNYRVGGFGFLPGKEILADGAANLGLLDQRLGLQWVADNIAAFGGDPSKVTIWGESAGAISVADQMLLYNGDNTYNGKPLFRGAIMNSGSIIPADPVDCPRAQDVYDTVVAAGGCSGAADTLECLRGLDYTTYLNAANSVPGLLSYTSVALSYLPRPDGAALSDSPDIMVQKGQYAAVPMIIGDQEDEGTLFSLFQSNITTEALLVQYLNDIFFHDATEAQIQALVDTYPADPSAGSPFGTGILWEVYPEFKRLAAILGDLVFTLTRRGFLTITNQLHSNVPSWSYLASYDKGTPILGTFHGGDILQVFYGILPDYASASIQTYYINFVNNLDPNVGVTKYANWPQWSSGQQLMQFNNNGYDIIDDTFRQESYTYALSNLDAFHI